jgi:hypothetical protein
MKSGGPMKMLVVDGFLPSQSRSRPMMSFDVFAGRWRLPCQQAYAAAGFVRDMNGTIIRWRGNWEHMQLCTRPDYVAMAMNIA